jgi:hypothetical protein
MTPKQERALNCKFFETGGACSCTERLNVLHLDNRDCEEFIDTFNECMFWKKREEK